jgi:hypothetical protein
MRRRAFLGAVGAVATSATLGTLGTAHAQGTLEATLSVIADATDETGDVGNLWVEIRNDRPGDGAPIDPVIQCWAMERQTQLAWTLSPAAPVEPGTERVIHASAPGERVTTRLPPGNRAMARLWDRGTDQSAHTTWVVD